jgi:hypothetical protein
MTPQNIIRDYLEGLVHSAIASAKSNTPMPKPPIMLGTLSLDVAETTKGLMAAIDTYTQGLADTAYTQGVQDALFNPQEHTPEEIAARNMRIESDT